jgi:hypothetical protein
MYADVERFRSDAAQHYLRVVQQQGRVMMAAEANEQVDILLRHLRTLAVDLFGGRGTTAVQDAAGAFKAGPGFAVAPPTGNTGFTIKAGHYWVGGKLVETETDTSFTGQPDLPPPAGFTFPSNGVWIVYLDVWERHVSAAEDPDLLEVALGGQDSCSRTKLVWQARLLQAAPGTTADQIRADWTGIHEKTDELRPLSASGRLAADVNVAQAAKTPCLAAPTSGYTGGENQLIRVEIHRGGKNNATFKWAYDNASVVHRLERVNGTSVTFSRRPLDLRKSFDVGTCVELLSAHQVRRGEPGMLTTVQQVVDDADDYELILDKAAPFSVGENQTAAGGWALLRRWNHPLDPAADGARTLQEGKKLALADGVVVTFDPPAAGAPARDYRPGDYWTIPVRVATGDVIWPKDNGKPRMLPPQGVEHSYAPLAVLTFGGGGAVQPADARHVIKPIGAPA